jgi:Xaa-Pro dipeptidase
VIKHGEIVLCDFGGTMNDYCSDITRCVHIGEPPSDIAEAYSVLFESQAAGVAAGIIGSSCSGVDAASRGVIDAAGFGEWFVHRTGHGIGMEAHEDPYMVAGNETPIAVGHAYSVEPGIYIPGKWGMRLEDIVVATATGPQPVNHTDHHLILLDR